MKKSILILLVLGLTFSLMAQSYNIKPYKISKLKTFDPKSVKTAFNASIKPVEEAPFPSGNSYHAQLLKAKELYAKQHPPLYFTKAVRNTNAVDAPQVLESFGTYWNHPTNGLTPHTGGTPNDNTLAFSNDGKILVSWNSLIYGYDLKADTPLFKPNQFLTTLSFQDFADGKSTSSPFDPKILYDPNEDRFVLLFLSGRTPSDSKTIIGFSSTNNPVDPWHVYEIDGNPLKNNTWTDYPQIALTENELFYTVNLLKAGQGWIEGFDRTIIWQIDKYSGFKGADSLELDLWDSIYYDNKAVRYFRPIKTGAGPGGPEMYFISNRGIPVEWNDNKIISSDTLFLIKVDNERKKNPKLTVKQLTANIRYHTPTNATQANSHIFFTNDTRILGGFYNNNEIQFVGNTMDTTTNRPAIYHGIIKNVSGNPSVQLNVIGDGQLDYGFPNIAYTGIKSTNQSSVIGFNHTSATENAGFSCVYYDGNGNYSPTKKVAIGDSYVDMISGVYERWGDYFGIQRNFRSPKQVWLSGYKGFANTRSSTWITQVKAPSDPNDPDEGIDTTYYPVGVSTPNSTPISSNVYPNPANDRFSVIFNLPMDSKIKVTITSMNGTTAYTILEGLVSQGDNELSFNTFDLSKGIYILSVFNQDQSQEILNKRLVIH